MIYECQTENINILSVSEELNFMPKTIDYITLAKLHHLLQLRRILHRSADVGALPEAGIQDLLSKAEVMRGDLEELVGVDELDRLLEAHEPGRDEAESFVCAGGAGVGQMLGLADVDIDVDGLAALTDDHSCVDFFAGSDEELAALLSTEQAVSDGSTGLKGDQ